MNTTTEQPALTFGQKAVMSHQCNDFVLAQIAKCRATCAEAIDQMNDIRNEPFATGETKALCTIAIRKLQSAQMDMVKAITWKD